MLDSSERDKQLFSLGEVAARCIQDESLLTLLKIVLGQLEKKQFTPENINQVKGKIRDVIIKPMAQGVLKSDILNICSEMPELTNSGNNVEQNPEIQAVPDEGLLRRPGW